MLNKIPALLIISIAALALACGGKKESEQSSEAKEWKEMDNFHMVMAEAFHPYKDSADLKPAKEVASELASAAKDWKNSKVPDGVDADKMTARLEQLVNGTEEFAQQAATESDEALGEKLTGLHDLFHEMQNDYYEGASGGHHHGDEHDHEKEHGH
jgi:hypothetical protein